MDFGPDILLLLTTVAMMGGIIDAIAGGGGLLIVPVLLWTGMPPLTALGTNKLQSMVGTGTACFRFARAGMIDWRSSAAWIVAAFLGAAGGTVLVQSVDQSWLRLIVPVLLIAVALYFLLSRRMDDKDAHQRLRGLAFAPVAALVALYDGFFGPGAGAFYTAALVALAGMGLTRATAHTKALNVVSNMASVLVFASSGHILWLVGACMALGQIVGASIGSHLALRHGARIIRPLLVAISIALTARMLLDPENPLRLLLS